MLQVNRKESSTQPGLNHLLEITYHFDIYILYQISNSSKQKSWWSMSQVGTVFSTEGITHLTAKYSVAGPGFLGKSWSKTLWSSCSQTLWPLQEQIGEMVKTGKKHGFFSVFTPMWVLFRIAKVSSDAGKQFITFSSLSNFRMLT